MLYFHYYETSAISHQPSAGGSTSGRDVPTEYEQHIAYILCQIPIP
ncbi:MAG: hypothetical protein ABH886_00860 [Candidatus Desantisbacteria bacterium]